MAGKTFGRGLSLPTLSDLGSGVASAWHHPYDLRDPEVPEELRIAWRRVCHCAGEVHEQHLNWGKVFSLPLETLGHCPPQSELWDQSVSDDLEVQVGFSRHHRALEMRYWRHWRVPCMQYCCVLALFGAFQPICRAVCHEALLPLNHSLNERTLLASFQQLTNFHMNVWS